MLRLLYDPRTCNHHTNVRLELIILERRKSVDNEKTFHWKCRISIERKRIEDLLLIERFNLPMEYTLDDDRVPEICNQFAF